MKITLFTLLGILILLQVVGLIVISRTGAPLGEFPKLYAREPFKTFVSLNNTAIEEFIDTVKRV